MKSGSDNFRQSAIQEIIENLKLEGVNILIYEPTLNEDNFNGYTVENDFKIFTKNLM